jgi:L-fuculose-phosphate aldolase
MMFQQARETIVETCINLADRGYLAGTGGNMALRAGEDHMLVTPSGVDYYTMGAGDICVIRLSDHQQVEGEMEASVESGMHVRVLAARPDCLASVHTHQPIASAYTLLAAALAVKGNSLRLMLGAEVPCVAYAPSGTGMLARKVGKIFNATTHACLMRNHGVVCVGTSIDEAVSRVAALESACADFFRSNQVASPPERQQTGTLIRQTLQAVANQPLSSSR